MHDVLCQIVLAVGDEDLLAGDEIVVTVADCPALELAEIGAGLRFGQVHGSGPFAGNHLGQVSGSLFGRAVMMDGIDRALVQQQHQAEAHICRLPHLLHSGREQPRHALAAELGVEGERVPAAGDEFLVDAGKAWRGADNPVLQLGADLVAVAVERRQTIAGELGGLLQHRVDRVVGRVFIARQRRNARQTGHFAQRETHVGEWGGVSHVFSSGPQYAAPRRFWRPAQVPWRQHDRHRAACPVLLEIVGPRATITLNDPAKHNRLDPAGLKALRAAIEKADADPAVRVTVITGAGEKTFCSGYDLGSISASERRSQSTNDDSFEKVMDRLEAMRMPTLCALNGGVYGGATDLALACDFRLGVRGMKFFMPAARFGLHYYPGGLRRYTQ